LIGAAINGKQVSGTVGVEEIIETEGRIGSVKNVERIAEGDPEVMHELTIVFGWMGAKIRRIDRVEEFDTIVLVPPTGL